MNNTSHYLILKLKSTKINDLVHGYKFISSYDDNSKLNVYELIGAILSNDKHAVTFAKKGSADNSWCGIDSNRNANDNNYKLDDILYNKEPWYNNTYLAKVYADEEGTIYNKSLYMAQELLYKKIS